MQFGSGQLSSTIDEREYATLCAADPLLICLDFDGTLAPIVKDPQAATIHPEAAEVLTDLGASGARMAVVTGRPVAQVLSLGDLVSLGEVICDAGGDLIVLGQYGNERWSAGTNITVSAEAPVGLAGFIDDLPHLLGQARAEGAWIEEKGLAVAVHTRRCADPKRSFEALLPVLTRAAGAHGLQVEPGKFVIEIRAAGMDKGKAIEGLVEEFAATGVVFVGDDLGDVPAFNAVSRLRLGGMPTLSVCSGSVEESALAELADVVVDGVPGVLDLLRVLTSDIYDAPR